MSVESITTEIFASNFTNEDLNTIAEMIRFKRSRLVEQNKRQLTINSKVEFTSSKDGRVLKGTVTKIAVKNVTVNTYYGSWRVPANMLRIVE